MRALMVVGALLWSGAAFADLPAADAEGWFRWVIDNDEQSIVSVRLNDGELTGLRVHNHYYNCIPGREPEATDLGVVSGEENFRWFRAFVEDTGSDRDSRESALVGIVQSGTDEAFAYMERLIGI